MPAIPKYLQICRIDNLVAAVGVLVKIEKLGVTACGKFAAIGRMPAVAQSLQVRSVDVAIAVDVAEDAAEQGKGGERSYGAYCYGVIDFIFRAAHPFQGFVGTIFIAFDF